MLSRKRAAAGQPPAGLQQQQQSESLLPPPQQQAKSEDVPLYDASDLANVLDLDADMLRGIKTTALLDGHGRLFAEDGAVARADPAGVFALSKPVPQLDLFISHAWRTERWPKYICLLLYLNFRPAIGAYAVGAYIAFWCGTFFFDFLPDFIIFDEQPGMFDAVQLRSTWVCSMTAVVALLVVLLTAHRWRPKSCFLDVCCIDQLDASKKAKGISALGAVLDRSERMVVILDEHYLKRIWCIFELAAFAKRGSMARCDFVPLHVALQRAALTAVVIGFPLVNCATAPIIATLPKEAGVTVLLPFFAVILAPPYALLLYAINMGRGTTLALKRLKDFRLADAECYSASDREAIVSLISRWFADTSSPDENVDEARRQAIGEHNFEQFIRRDVVARLQATLGHDGSATWTSEFSFLFFLTTGGAWALDMMTVPEFSMYYLIPCAAQNFVLYLLGGPIFGWGAALAADGIVHAQQTWRWSACSAYVLVGVPIIMIFFTLALLSTGITNPSFLFKGTDTTLAAHTFPDDGLDEFGRAQIKVQLVTLLLGSCMVVAQASRS